MPGRMSSRQRREHEQQKVNYTSAKAAARAVQAMRRNDPDSERGNRLQVYYDGDSGFWHVGHRERILLVISENCEN